jgi:hypothetical protein
VFGISTLDTNAQFEKVCRLRFKCDGTRAETRFRLSPKRTSPFVSAGASVQSTAGSRGVGISVSNAGYTTFRGSVRVLAIHSIRQFPVHFSSRASPCAIRFQTHSTECCSKLQVINASAFLIGRLRFQISASSLTCRVWDITEFPNSSSN